MKTRLILLALAVLSCASRKVVVGGVEMPVEEAAAAEVGHAQRLLAEGKLREAADAASEAAQKYQDTEQADDALFLRAWALEQAGDLAGAEAAFQELLAAHPGSPRAVEAAIHLGQVQIAQGRPQEGAPALAALYDRAQGPDKILAARALGDGWLAMGKLADAARWYALAAAEAEGAQGGVITEKAVAALDAAPFLDVARLKEELPRTNPLWPAVALKLARIHLHLRDAARAAATAEEAAAAGGPWGTEARALLDQLASRAVVAPDAIGVILPLSGKYKAYGDAILNGLGLAVDLTGKGGIRVITRDSRGEPEGAVQAVEELVTQEHVIAILGPVLAAEAEPAAAKADELGVPMISLSRVEGLTQIGPWVFRNQLTNSAQAEALATYAVKELGLKSFAILEPDIAYGNELASFFWDAVVRLGGEVRGAERYPHDETTFAPYVKRLVGRYHLDERTEYVEAMKKAREEIKDPYRLRKELERLQRELAPVVDFDALFIPDSYRTATLIAPALAVEDVVTYLCDQEELEKVKKTTKRPDLKPIVLLGANGWNHPDLVVRGGKYVQCSVFVDGFYEQSGRRQTQEFAQRYRETYHKAPGLLEASAFDTMKIARYVLEKAKPTNREAFRAALAAVKDFPGATGDLTFGPDREARRPLFFLTVDKGGIREIPRDVGAGGDGR